MSGAWRGRSLFLLKKHTCMQVPEVCADGQLAVCIRSRFVLICHIDELLLLRMVMVDIIKYDIYIYTHH